MLIYCLSTLAAGVYLLTRRVPVGCHAQSFYFNCAWNKWEGGGGNPKKKQTRTDLCGGRHRLEASATWAKSLLSAFLFFFPFPIIFAEALFLFVPRWLKEAQAGCGGVEGMGGGEDFRKLFA